MAESDGRRYILQIVPLAESGGNTQPIVVGSEILHQDLSIQGTANPNRQAILNAAQAAEMVRSWGYYGQSAVVADTGLPMQASMEPEPWMPPGLPNRLSQILRLWRKGYTDSQIADTIGWTVQSVRKRIFEMRREYKPTVVPYHGSPKKSG